MDKYTITEFLGSHQLQVNDNSFYYEVPKEIVNIIKDLENENEQLKEKVHLLNEMNEMNYNLYCEELKKRNELKNKLIGEEKFWQNEVKELENKLRNTDKDSFYYQSHLKNIHKYNAKRELIKDILKYLESRSEE